MSPKFYGCPPIDNFLEEVPDFSQKHKGNMKVTTHVWFAWFLDCEMDSIVKIVHACKALRAVRNVVRQAGTVKAPFSKHIENVDSNEQIHDSMVHEKRGKLVQGRDERPKKIPSLPYVDTTSTSDRPKLAKAIIDLDHDNTDVHELNDLRKTSSVFQYFKESKFTGDIRQSIELTLRDYNVCARQHNPTLNQKAYFFVNVLAHPARPFFFNHARDDMSFDEMAQLIIDEYNSNSRQLRV